MHRFRNRMFALLTALLLLAAPAVTYADEATEAAKPILIANTNPGDDGGETPPDSGTPPTDPGAPQPPVQDPAQMKNRPKIVIDTYTMDPNPVSAGDKFTLAMTFYNTNGVNSIRNLKVTLSTADTTQASGTVFIPDNTSNTFYARYIAPEGEVTKRVTMYCVPDAAQRTYTMTATFEYEDADGNQYTSTENFGIPVVQRVELNTAQINMPSELQVGMPQFIPLQYYNTSKSTLYNLKIKVEGDLKTEVAEQYVGNMQSGAQDTFELNVTPETPGEANGKIVFTYEDVTGNEYTKEVPFTANVIEMEYPGPGEGDFPDDMPPEPTAPFYMNPLVWIGVALAAVIAFLIVRRRKKKKEEEALEIHE